MDGAAIFKEIAERPYRVGTALNVRAENCYFKNSELMERLEKAGYMVRARIGETYWPEVIPAEVRAQMPGDILTTHYFLEVRENGEWRAVDASFQNKLGHVGLTTGSWENGEVCFPITRLFTEEEMQAYLSKWQDGALQKDYFHRAGKGLKALNVWFEKVG